MLPNDLLIDDFAGDYKAFTMAKMEGGIKMLSQHEKLKFFGIADERMKDGIKELKKLCGMDESG